MPLRPVPVDTFVRNIVWHINNVFTISIISILIAVQGLVRSLDVDLVAAKANSHIPPPPKGEGCRGSKPCTIVQTLRVHPGWPDFRVAHDLVVISSLKTPELPDQVRDDKLVFKRGTGKAVVSFSH